MCSGSAHQPFLSDVVSYAEQVHAQQFCERWLTHLADPKDYYEVVEEKFALLAKSLSSMNFDEQLDNIN